LKLNVQFFVTFLAVKSIYDVSINVHSKSKILYKQVRQQYYIRQTWSAVKTTVCAKNETRIILNILYTCKSVAIRFSTWYSDNLSY